MGLSTEREDPRAPLTPPRSPSTEGHREPAPPVEDELGLLGHDSDPDLDRLDLPSEPEDYFPADPDRSHREFL